MKKRLCSVLIAILALTLTACHRNEAIPVCPSLSDETVGGLPSALVQAPAMGIQYQDEEFLCSATLTPSVHTHPLGAAFPAGTRPCEQEQLCTVTMADTVGEVRLAYFPEEMNAIEGAEFYAAEALTGLTLTAYPAAEDGTVDLTPEKAQTIPVANGRFTLLVGRYYYELTLPQDGGQLVYGFLAHRIDAEEYKVTEHVSGCCVEIEYEDPDYQVKQLPRLHLLTPFGREGNARSGRLLLPCGQVLQTYQNYAGTEITRQTDLGDPMKEAEDDPVTYTWLNIDHEIEWPWSHKVTAAHYERYTHDGTLVDGKSLIAADITGTNVMHLEPNYYYVFTVYYEDVTARYAVKTGAGVDEIASHPKDDPNIDPALAKYLRAAHLQWVHSSLDSLDTVDLYIYRYLGRFGDMEAVIFEETGDACGHTYSTDTVTLGGHTLAIPDGRRLYFYHTHRFYTPEEVYANGWITDAEASTVAALCKPAIGQPSPMRSEESAPVWLARHLPYTADRTLELTPIGESGIDPSAGEEMYEKANIGTVKFAELPTEFEIRWDARIAVEDITVTRYPLFDHAKGEICPLSDCKLVFEAGYYYEITLLTPTGSVQYGITTASETTTPTSETNPRDISIRYSYLGEEKETLISRSMSSCSWTSGYVSQTASPAPYMLPGLCEFHATEGQVTLFENKEVAAFVISVMPLNDKNMPITASDDIVSFTVTDNTFSLREGSYYYAVNVCFTGFSYHRYGFIAHYTPNETGGNS
ncbi:MAG: hypothetical protein IJW99_02575 [Clostridia bacterium]|nr:hypothetical protein [Clostridia bacterium]